MLSDWPLLEGSINKKELESSADERIMAFYKREFPIHFSKVLERMSEIKPGPYSFESTDGVVHIGKPAELSPSELALCHELAKTLGPWRKGPYNLFGAHIDSEWRSDIKWEKLLQKIPDLKGQTVLDVGCNNGYFLYRMLEQNPKFVLGIDPVDYCYGQFLFLNHFVQDKRAQMEMLGVDELKNFTRVFDSVFSMGVIYHHRHPLLQLEYIHNALKPGGTLILETITIPGKEEICLFPKDRYAQMRNVYFIPTKATVMNWLERMHFKKIEIVFDSKLTSEEQRVTPWSPNRSLADFLSPTNPDLTIEGHPAPWRTAFIAST